MSGIQESMPALIDVHYKCRRCGMSAKMERFYGGPAYAHHWYYAIKCSNPMCMNHSIGMRDWKDSPEEAITAWNRKVGDAE